MDTLVNPTDLTTQVATYHQMGAICLPTTNKEPLCKWREVSTQLSLDAFGSATGIAVINGKDNWRSIDIDHCKDSGEPVCWSVVDTLLKGLALPTNYKWVVKSGSGHGYHIWFKAEDKSSVSSNQWYVPIPDFAGKFGHLELRWKENITILPPSLHESGNRYEFVGEIPLEGPAYVSYEQVMKALELVSLTKGSGITGPVAGGANDTAGDPRFSPGNDPSLEKMREEFDLLTAVKKYLRTDDVEEADHEFRVGKPGTGLGGWHVKKDNRTWNTFLDGTGELGGDCFDFVGYLVYQAEWSRNNAQHFKHVLKTTREMTTNNYSLPKPRSKSKDYDPSKTSCVEVIQRYMLQRAAFRHNNVTSRLEWAPIGSNLWEPSNERQIRGWLVDIEKCTGFTLSYDRLMTYVDNPEVAKPVDPFRDYFDGLVYDGKDHLSDLLACVEAESPDDFKLFLYKWLLGTYACAYYGGQTHRNEMFLVLTGAQGVGKTTFIRSLVPSDLSSYVHRGVIDDKKDTIIKLRESFLSINDELSTLRKTDIESLKARISEDKICVRKTYGRESEDKPRRVSYCGTTNEAEFLQDVTGNRRFLVFELKSVDRDKLYQVSIDGLWAQMRWCFQQGQKHYLDENDTARLEVLNQRYRMVSQIEELLQRYFEPADLEDPLAQKLTTTQVFEQLAIEHEAENSSPSRVGVPRLQQNPGTLRHLGTCLKALLYLSISHRPNGGSPRKCWVLKKKPRNVISPQVYNYNGMKHP